MNPKARIAILALLALLGTGGCASYEYQLTQPPAMASHIGKGADLVIDRDPLEYRLITVDSRLVMRIYNHTDDSVQLLGSSSTVVSSDGQSHPLRDQTIATGSFIKLIFPPQRPQIQPSGPTIGIGVGFASRRHGGFYDPLWDEPRYYDVYSDNEFYWDWNGETPVRLTLVFDRGGKHFTHDFTLLRQKT